MSKVEGGADRRRSYATRNLLDETLMIGLLSTVCGGEGCTGNARFGRKKEPFLRGFMQLEHGIPSDDGCSGLFNALDPVDVQAVLLRLVASRARCMMTMSSPLRARCCGVPSALLRRARRCIWSKPSRPRPV